MFPLTYVGDSRLLKSSLSVEAHTDRPCHAPGQDPDEDQYLGYL